MRKPLRLRGVHVGSRVMFEEVNRAIAAHPLQPVIDRAFAFDDACDAYRHMSAADYFGKIVITSP